MSNEDVIKVKEFEEKFPSLKNKIWIRCHYFKNSTIEEKSIKLSEETIKAISEGCLDKQRVMEAIDKIFIHIDDKTPFLADIRKKEFLEELGL